MGNWVSAGCGVIANELAQAMEKRGQKLYGVVNRTQEKAVAFAKKYGVQNVFTSFEEVCADPAVDIMKRLTKSLKTLKWILSISQRLIIRIFNFYEKLWQQVSMCCARNPLR